MAFWRRPAKPPPAPSPAQTAREWWQALEPLGPFRQQVIACLRGDLGHGRNSFSPADGDTLFDAFRQFVLRADAASNLPDAVGRSVLAAGQLLTGDLTGADHIIDLLPRRPHRTDHGAGTCLRMPSRVLRHTLPWPDKVGDPDTWTAGSHYQATLRAWLTQQRDRLVWIEDAGVYRLGATLP